jgi:hypothetical protein
MRGGGRFSVTLYEGRKAGALGKLDRSLPRALTSVVVKTRGISGSHEPGVDVQFCARLEALDRAITERVRGAGCSHCGGRLDRADYARKPRGADIAPAGEAWSKRLSLCCAREGCRRRATPPSVRFLGRRVYVEVVVLIACVAAEMEALAPTKPPASVPRRTVRRWLAWWRTAFVASALWRDLRARFAEPPAESELPASLLSRLDPRTSLLSAARLLSPLTTSSCAPERSRLVRSVM